MAYHDGRMDGIHDLGGMHGFGAIEVDRRELVTVMRRWRTSARLGRREFEVAEIRAFLPSEANPDA